MFRPIEIGQQIARVYWNALWNSDSCHILKPTDVYIYEKGGNDMSGLVSVP